MLFTIPRRWYSRLPQITVEIDASLANEPHGVRLGAAVKIMVGQAKEKFTGADLTRADLTGAVLTHADLTRADLTGAVLTHADLTGADLTGADLTGAVLTHADLTRADLTGADLTHAFLTRADLTHAFLTGADLTGADLTGAVLTHADLTDIPAIPNIDATILAAIEAGGALKMDAWHTCETTHCRAGWAISLAGKAGLNLERQFGPAAAGALIYAASRPSQPIPNFYADTETAMADIRRCAAEQTGEVAA